VSRRIDDRRVLNGIFWMLRSGAPWRNLPERYGQRTTCYNRFVRWRKAGVWDRMMDAIAAAHDGKKGIEIIVSVVPEAGSRSKSTRCRWARSPDRAEPDRWAKPRRAAG